MKKLMTLLLVLFSVTAMSQFLRNGNHVILIRNVKTAKFARITENSNISVLTTSGKSISGKVRLIKSDTIFFQNNLVSVPEIEKIYFQSRFAFPDQPAYDSKRPAYQSGSPKFKIIVPPDSVYRKQRTYQSYLHMLNMTGKRERLATFNPLVYKNFVKWNISKLVHLELAFSYERQIAKKITWETEISAILGIPSAEASYTIDYPLFNYSGFSVTTYPKFYIMGPTFYLSPVLMYRNLWVKGMRTDWPERASANGLLQDQYRNDIGLSLRFGTMRRYGKTVVDWYIGGGIKYVYVHELVYAYYLYHDSNAMQWTHPDHSADGNDRFLFQPVINLGIKIGRAF